MMPFALLLSGPPDSPFVWITQGITELLTSKSDVFWAQGMNLFRGLAIIMICWFGIQTALASVSGGSIRWDRFASLLMTIAFGFAMIKFYEAPIPGIGRNFHKLITDEAADLAATIELRGADEVSLKLADTMQKMEAPSGPSLFDAGQLIRYYGIVLVGSFIQGVILFVIAYGFIALAAVVLVGPIFIPFFIVPHMERFFWGWFSCLLQFSFYPVIANVFVYIFSKFFLNFLAIHPPPYDAPTIAGLFVAFGMMSLAFIWGMLKIPSLVSSIFSGRSGDHAFPGMGAWR